MNNSIVKVTAHVAEVHRDGTATVLQITRYKGGKKPSYERYVRNVRNGGYVMFKRQKLECNYD